MKYPFVRLLTLTLLFAGCAFDPGNDAPAVAADDPGGAGEVEDLGASQPTGNNVGDLNLDGTSVAALNEPDAVVCYARSQLGDVEDLGVNMYVYSHLLLGVPIHLDQSQRVTGLGALFAGGGWNEGALVQLALYSAREDGSPDVLIAASGLISSPSGATTAPITPVDLEPGQYWVMLRTGDVLDPEVYPYNFAVVLRGKADGPGNTAYMPLPVEAQLPKQIVESQVDTSALAMWLEVDDCP